MAQTMTASVQPETINDGQIENLVDKLRAAVRKHRAEIPKDVAQQVLGVENLGMEFFAVIRKHIELLVTLIVRTITVDCSRTPQQALEATGRKLYVDDAVVATMPRGEGKEVKVFFFKPELWEYGHVGWMSDEALKEAYTRRYLTPVDPITLAKANEDDPTFADTHPNATHWKNVDGKWCYASFDRWSGERLVDVYRSDLDWNGRWQFAGVPQVEPLIPVS